MTKNSFDIYLKKFIKITHNNAKNNNTHLNWNPTKEKFVGSIAVGLSWYNQVITGWRNTILGDRSILKNVIFAIELVTKF